MSQPRRPGGAALGLSLALHFCVAAVGGAVTAPSVKSWYATLTLPSFNPPAFVFGPVWTVLYALMAVAAWRIWRTAPGAPAGRRAALAAYGVQLGLNLAWSMLFFGLHAPLAALVDLALLLAALLLTFTRFWRLDRIAALLMVPYLAWSAFAFVLNAAVCALNP
jgi:tryptophan-rich sensory protein